MRKLFYPLLSICLFYSLNSWAFECQFEAPPTVIETSKNHLIQYWDFSNSSIMDSSFLPDSSSLNSYKELIQSKIDTDPLKLLIRYSYANPNDNDNDNDNYNLNIVIKSPTKYIRPVRCLESLLLSNQIERNTSMSINPTEFLAFFLKNNDARLRVYYLTDDISGVRNISSLYMHIEEDINNGWAIIGNLHNHSFFLDNLNQDEFHHPQGVLIPSASDIQVLRATTDEFKMEYVSITNGFNTISIPIEDLNNFHDPQGK